MFASVQYFCQWTIPQSFTFFFQKRGVTLWKILPKRYYFWTFGCYTLRSCTVFVNLSAFFFYRKFYIFFNSDSRSSPTSANWKICDNKANLPEETWSDQKRTIFGSNSIQRRIYSASRCIGTNTVQLYRSRDTHTNISSHICQSTSIVLFSFSKMRQKTKEKTRKYKFCKNITKFLFQQKNAFDNLVFPRFEKSNIAIV